MSSASGGTSARSGSRCGPTCTRTLIFFCASHSGRLDDRLAQLSPPRPHHLAALGREVERLAARIAGDGAEFHAEQRVEHGRIDVGTAGDMPAICSFSVHTRR
jgi:hypothetical protein